MSYSAELCRLVICNMEILEEAPSIVASVEATLFAAIDERIKRRIEKQNNWEGVYSFSSGEEETTFAPKSWPKTKDADESCYAWYELDHTEDGEELDWLSSATGLRNAALCLQFDVDMDLCGFKNAKEYKNRLLRFYAGASVLHEAGFHFSEFYGVIYRPFAFDAGKLAEEYPDFDKALEPLDAALEDLFKAHDEFDKFVKGLE